MDIKNTSTITSSEDKNTSVSTNSSEANAETCNQIVESIVSESEQIVQEKPPQNDDDGKLIRLFYTLKKNLGKSFLTLCFKNSNS